MNEQPPFVLQRYDTLSDEYFDIWPVENNTYDSLDDAYEGAGTQLREIKETPPNDIAGVEKNTLYIVDVNGKRIQYP